MIGALLAAGRRVGAAWDRFWFASEPVPQLDLVRAGLGLAMFVSFLSLTPRVPELYADGGWVPRAALRIFIDNPWSHSVFFHLHGAGEVLAFHYAFLAALACLAVGLGTPVVKWIALAGQVSYAYRCPPTTYGVDEILPSLMLILCLAPIGRHFSVDALIRRAIARRRGRPPRARRDGWGFACARLMQIQIATIFFITGMHKARGNEWWEGDALWNALTNYQFDAPLDFFARNYWLINLLTHFTLGVEIAYVFLIWGRRRPIMLALAMGLHAGIAVLMGLYYFSFVNLMAHASFLRPEWIERALAAARRLAGRAPGAAAATAGGGEPGPGA